jgi:hypothetical protein
MQFPALLLKVDRGPSVHHMARLQRPTYLQGPSRHSKIGVPWYLYFLPPLALAEI